MSVAIPPRTHASRNGGTQLATGSAAPEISFDHEEIVVRRGERSGCCIAVAVHSTALGPALGGVRLWHYPGTGDAIADVLRLARGMTMKAAAAGLDLGGGKGVIAAPSARPPSGSERAAMLHDFGDLVESLEGRYITAEDVGISPEDIGQIATRTEHVTGLPEDLGGSGDPSPFTAAGVEAAMRACAADRIGTRDLAGLSVCVIGIGHVGARLATRLIEQGAEVTGSDVAPGKRALARRLGIGWAAPEDAMLGEYDIVAPCALGGAIDVRVAEELRCRIVCGAANNQLANDSLAERLADRGILYAPDYIVNAGGLIHVYMEIRGYDEDEAAQMALGIERTMDRILADARRGSTMPLAAARRLAAARLLRAGASAQVPHWAR